MSALTAAKRGLCEGLSGRGIEIGAFHSPMWVPDGASVTYVDELSAEEAAVFHQEGMGHGSGAAIEPDIVGPADALPAFADGAADFLLASHLFEHLRDPVKALVEWHRVLATGGDLVLIIPDRRYTFDRTRPLTSVQHQLEDYALGAQHPLRRARDLEHATEWAREVVGHEEPAGAALWGTLLEACNYSIHFHTFEPHSFDELIEAVAGEGLARFAIEERAEAPRCFEFARRLRAL